MAWYHTFNKKVHSGDSIEIEKTFHEMTKTIPTAPKIKRSTQFYSKKYYDTRVKPTVDAEWELVKDTLPQPKHIAFSNKVTERMYEGESQSFKDRMDVERNEEHLDDMTKYKRIVDRLEALPDSPKSFHE
jgi:hypothetical protein